MALVNRWDNLKDKRAYRKIWAFLGKSFSFSFLSSTCWFMCKKNFTPTFFVLFCFFVVFFLCRRSWYFINFADALSLLSFKIKMLIRNVYKTRLTSNTRWSRWCAGNHRLLDMFLKKSSRTTLLVFQKHLKRDTSSVFFF